MEQVDINNLIFGGRRVKKTDLSDIMYDFFFKHFFALLAYVQLILLLLFLGDALFIDGLFQLLPPVP